MAETSYPVAGGGAVTDAAYEKLMADVTGSGLIGAPTVSSLMYADSTGRQIKLKALRQAIIRGFRWETDASGLTVPVPANISGYPRLDLGVLQLDRADFRVRFLLKQGVPGTNPVAPPVEQNTLADGVWEIPVGTVRVASTTTTQANSGLPSIAAADVTAMDYFLAPPGIVTHSARMPPAKPGQVVTQWDKGRTLAAYGDQYHLIGENGPRVKLAVKGGWDNANVWVTRRNGFVFMHAILYRNTPGKTTARSTDIVLFNVPDEYRPHEGPLMYLAGTHQDWFARFYFNGTTGDVGILGYDNALADNHFVVIHPVTWPAKY
ncbi:hypothetical protein [Micromonospora sp. RV43]|uniref:hypothetical protein n=1 Tax=Micromonospora sp. RV43 TaxID=1661387 RepID=UPI00069CFEA8|nr:hypothetical protein [Micromonospora sp. RV43]